MDGARRRLAREVERNAGLARSRDILLREVQHRVSNNIQVVSALLQLEARGASDEGARKILLAAASRTALIARIQRNLSDADGRATDFPLVARTIVDDALKAAGRLDVTVAIHGEGATLSAEEATPVTLIMLECVNNALEHAFPDRSGHIRVSLIDDPLSRRLIVADDGVGLSMPAPKGPQSLGLRLIEGLSQQLAGQWTLTPASAGAIATLTWPRPAESA
jgi:two-component sensor histidine kinase